MPHRANTCLPTSGRCKLMLFEGHWGPTEEGDGLEISIFFLSKPQIEMILAVCQICLKLLLTKTIFVCVIVHKSFVL